MLDRKASLQAVDLFSGGGGLSVGLKQAGFNVVAAVEIEPNAAATYKANHPDTVMFDKDIRKLRAEELLTVSPTGKIDFLTGCPPCQGFTTLTTKYHRDDPRNNLINEMLRLIEDIKPMAVMLENVPGLAKKGENLLTPVVKRLEAIGYDVNLSVLQVADYGVPQFRRRLVMLAGLGFHIDLPAPTHSKSKDSLPNWVTVREAIGKSGKPMLFQEAKLADKLSSVNWHVVRELSPINKARIKVAQPGLSWRVIPENLRPQCHRGSYKGFPNVYGRMEWDKISPTITGGCTTLSRGRYGHPKENRTISVREAATLQTFPQDYIFKTANMEHVCNIIGNALPCEFAKKMAEQCYFAILRQPDLS